MGSSNTLCIFGEHSGELVSALHFWKTEWGAQTDSAFLEITARSFCKFPVFEKERGRFKQTAHFVKTEWGVEMNCAFFRSTVGSSSRLHICKNWQRVETNSILLENTVGSSLELRIFGKHSGEFAWTPHFVKTGWEFKQTLQRDVNYAFFKNTAESSSGLAHVVKTEWGIDVNSTFCKNRWEVETNPTLLEVIVGSSFEFCIF